MLGDKESLIPMFVLKCRERGRERERARQSAREKGKGYMGYHKSFLFLSFPSIFLSLFFFPFRLDPTRVPLVYFLSFLLCLVLDFLSVR
jgi:hypothetical protein